MVSLAEELALLANPKPVDYDPEDLERGEPQDKASDDEAKGREHYVAVDKSTLRDDNIVVDGKRYKGFKTSRKDLYADSEEDNASEDEEELDDDEDEEEEEGERDLEDEEMASASDEDDEEEVEEELEAPEAVPENKRNKLQAILDTEKKVLASQLSTIAHTDAEKGAAIQQQMNVYESILDTRIKLQKGLAAANTFPLTPASAENVKTDETDVKIEKLKKSLYKLLDELTSIRVNMMDADGIKVDSIKISKKRTFEDAIDNATQLESKLTSYRDAVLTKWSRKVQAASGASALNQSKFSIQNQNAQLQVSTNLADMDRLVKRTRINRSNYVLLGEEKETSDKEDNKEKANYKKNKVDANLQERTEIFDDTDFYRILLKDLVDRRMADAGNSEGVKWTVVKPKIKKVVDTKASKGRKLRYHVQEKILNFDAPRQFVQWNDDQIDELFAGLFGQKIEVDEIEEEEKEEQREEGEEVEKFEDFRLFG
ncbi:hypothetical protein D0Z00_002584 [Geotrichum galactomycetum]|uniref:Uncharacterized protein n=1 Tax=Geotrichum galactomycetum TaxID=27317 RepID=A0ACB6V3R0_9ASCO|nr:hypothetical protein D0Z00_002584 [Geotrichum candidum]